MRLLRHSLAAFVVMCCALGACGSNKRPATVHLGTIAQASSGSSVAGATQPPSVGGNVDCAALKTNLADLIINWQVVIGLTNTPMAEWANMPIGTVSKFGDQLAAITAELGGDGDARAALAYMSGANSIVAVGIGGDTAAQANLAAYLGTDVGANVGKQLPISIAYQKAGCK